MERLRNGTGARLTRHRTDAGPRWALDGELLPPGVTLSSLLALGREELLRWLPSQRRGPPAGGALLAPVDPGQEVWAAGVTYLRSREARRAESSQAALYDRVYDAERPELFFKATGARAVGPGEAIRVRRDSRWSVPEPELTVVADRHLEVVGYTAGNDVSSRDVEGENPLYLPQAKIYDGACALGPAIVLAPPGELRDLPVQLRIGRGGEDRLRGGGPDLPDEADRRGAPLLARA